MAARAGGDVRHADLADVCELCRRIDGLPLAIEITATRTRSLSVGEILEHLGDRLDTIEQGGFRRGTRQRTVRDAIEWSYQLLTPAQRQLFERLGVMAGLFSLDMAHGVGEGGRSGRPIDSTLDCLDVLVAASLVVAERAVDGTTWYRQLDAVRACARDHLAAQGDLEAATERFVDHMVGAARWLASQADEGWNAETLAAVSALPDSLMQALRWTIDHDASPERAFDLTSVLWGHQSRTDEVLEVARRAIERWADPSIPNWADAAATVATCQWIVGRRDDAEATIDRALPVAEHARFAAVLLRRVRGQLRREQGHYGEAVEWFAAAAAEARRRGLGALVIDAELLRAAALVAGGDVDTASAITRGVRSLPSANAVTEVLALSIESDALLAHRPREAVELARRGRELTATTWYAAASVGFGRTMALGQVELGDLGGAAISLLEALEAMTLNTTLSQAGSLLEAAAVVAHRSGHDEWIQIARAAGASPSAHLLSSAMRLMPDLPEVTAPIPDLMSALKLSEGVLQAVAAGRVEASSETGAGEPAPSGQRPSPGGEARNRWQRRGDHWELLYDGRTVLARDTKGMDDLARLLERPETEVAAIDLADAAVTSSDTGDVIDSTARRQYEDRIRELQADLVDAEDDNDVGRVELISADLDALVEQLSAAVGIGGRARRTGAVNDRARTAVTRRIRKAIAHLDELNPALGRHLDASIRTGTYCAYRPERPVEWEVSRG